MFSFPSLPTDSLYKFSFIGGLIIILYSFYSWDHEEKILQQNTVQLDSLEAVINEYNLVDSLEGVKNKAQIKYLRWGTDFFEDSYLEAIRAKKSPKSIQWIEGKQKQFANRLNDLKVKEGQRKRQIDEEVLKYKLLVNHFKANLEAADKIDTRNQWLLIIGIIATLIAQICWYTLLQRPQDELLKIQLQSARLALKEQVRKLEVQDNNPNPPSSSP